MPDKVYPYAVKYKGRYFAAGEMIKGGDKETAAPIAKEGEEQAAKAVKRKPARKKPQTTE